MIEGEIEKVRKYSCIIGYNLDKTNLDCDIIVDGVLRYNNGYYVITVNGYYVIMGTTS